MKYNKKLENQFKKLRKQYVADPPILTYPERKFYTADEIKLNDFKQWTIWKMFCSLAPLSEQFRKEVLGIEHWFDFPQDLPDYLPERHGFCVRDIYELKWKEIDIKFLHDTGEFCKSLFDMVFDRHRFLYSKYYVEMSFKGQKINGLYNKMQILQQISAEISQKIVAAEKELNEKLKEIIPNPACT